MLNQLNYRHLYYFWAVAKEGHLTRAAGKLHLAQSALSSQVRQLEERIGYPLFTREGKTLAVTEMGQVVLSYADSIFALGQELLATVHAGAGQAVERMRIGAVATLSRNFQENFLQPIVGRTDIQLVLESGGLDVLLQRLSLYQLDLVLSNSAVTGDPAQNWHCRLVARQPVCLVGPRLGRKRFRFPQDLPKVRLVLPGRSSDIRAQFDILREDLGLDMKVFAEVDDMAMLRLLARDSGAVSLVPAVVVQDELKSGHLQNYCEVPQVFENFYAITTERQFRPPSLSVLLGQQ